MLIRLRSESNKHAILSQAPRLRFHEQHKRVFISHDMTQSKHEALVQELNSRRAKGERNLMIRNGNIIVRYSRVVRTQTMLLLHQLQILPDVSSYTTGAGHHQSLNLMVINIQSITSKKEYFLECINYHNPDIVLGCEI